MPQSLVVIAEEHRLARALMYLAIVAAGIAVFFIPLAFFDKLQDATVGGVGVFLVVGGLISLVGHLVRILVVERAGYPLTLVALIALTTVLFLEADSNPARTFIGLIVLAFTFGLYGRGRDLSTLVKIQANPATATGAATHDHE